MLLNEWLAGTIGLSAYFGIKPVTVSKSQITQAMNAEKYILTRIRSWVAATKPSKFEIGDISMADYDLIVSNMQSPQLAHPDMSRIDPSMQVDFYTAFLDLGYYLKEIRPAVAHSGGLIAREVEPPSSDKARFTWACNIVNDIKYVFDLLDAGALTGVEADAFRRLFPETALFTASTCLQEIIGFIYSKEKSTLASWQLSGLSALMGVPITDFNDVLTWQAGYNPTKGPGRPPSQAPNLAGQAATDSQRKDFPR